MYNKIVILFISVLLCSCFVQRNVSVKNKNDFDFKVKFENDYYLGNLKIDSINSIRFRLYDNNGIKLSDFKIENDSIKFKYCIIDQIEKSISTYFYVYNNEISIDRLVRNLFKGFNFKNKNIEDYKLEYEIENNKDIIVKIYSIKNNLRLDLYSQNYILLDSTLIFRDVDVLINDKFKIQLFSINE